MSSEKNRILSRACAVLNPHTNTRLPLRGLKRLYVATPRRKRAALLARCFLRALTPLDTLRALEAVQWGEPPLFNGWNDDRFGRVQHAPNMRARTSQDGHADALRGAVLSTSGVAPEHCVPKKNESEREYSRRIRHNFAVRFGDVVNLHGVGMRLGVS